MIINKEELDKIIIEIKANPGKQEELLKDFKLFHAFFEEDDGIPPRFGKNFRENGPIWEKVTGLDFEAIGRVLVCHLSIEHYVNNLIELSTPKSFNWEKSRMSFNQKLNLVQDLVIFQKNECVKGIRILNEIRNKLSHELLANIDENKLKELHQILLKMVCTRKSQEENEEVKSHFNLFGPHAIIERFTSITCAMIAGYCSRIIDNKMDAEEYYNQIRNK
jgi:hypothetical protein